MKFFYQLIIFSSLVLISSCATNKIEGLWLVEKVQAGQEEMTPQARWVKFNSDFTQQSGNGWFQHSVGTWKLNKAESLLNIINTNGYIDSSDPFKIQLDGNEMYWKRIEEGQEVEIILKKINKLPQTPGDQLLGVWDLMKITEEGVDITKKYDPENKQYLYIRWDRIFIMQNTQNGRLRGIYKTHGHRPEIEFIFYNSNERQTWNFEVTTDKIIFKSKIDDKETVMEYQRINYFPK